MHRLQKRTSQRKLLAYDFRDRIKLLLFDMGRSPGPLPFTRFPHAAQHVTAEPSVQRLTRRKGPPATAAACPVQLNPPVSRYSLEERLPASRVVFHAAHCVVDVRFYRMDRLRLLPHQKPNGPCRRNARVLWRGWGRAGARLCHRAELLLQDLLPLGEGRSALRPKAQACYGTTALIRRMPCASRRSNGGSGAD